MALLLDLHFLLPVIHVPDCLIPQEFSVCFAKLTATPVPGALVKNEDSQALLQTQ